MVVELFGRGFDPDGPDGVGTGSAGGAAAEELAERIRSALDDVASLNHDRILRALLAVVRATDHTNYYQPPGPIDGAADRSAGHRPTVALKLAPRRLALLPEPRPWAEIFVYGVAVEGVHLRYGPVARGGLRWS